MHHEPRYRYENLRDASEALGVRASLNMLLAHPNIVLGTSSGAHLHRVNRYRDTWGEVLGLLQQVRRNVRRDFRKFDDRRFARRTLAQTRVSFLEGLPICKTI